MKFKKFLLIFAVLACGDHIGKPSDLEKDIYDQAYKAEHADAGSNDCESGYVPTSQPGVCVRTAGPGELPTSIVHVMHVDGTETTRYENPDGSEFVQKGPIVREKDLGLTGCVPLGTCPCTPVAKPTCCSHLPAPNCAPLGTTPYDCHLWDQVDSFGNALVSVNGQVYCYVPDNTKITWDLARTELATCHVSGNGRAATCPTDVEATSWSDATYNQVGNSISSNYYKLWTADFAVRMSLISGGSFSRLWGISQGQDHWAAPPNTVFPLGWYDWIYANNLIDIGNGPRPALVPYENGADNGADHPNTDILFRFSNANSVAETAWYGKGLSDGPEATLGWTRDFIVTESSNWDGSGCGIPAGPGTPFCGPHVYSYRPGSPSSPPVHFLRISGSTVSMDHGTIAGIASTNQALYNMEYALVAHETGHSLGLGHTGQLPNPQDLMAASIDTSAGGTHAQPTQFAYWTSVVNRSQVVQGFPVGALSPPVSGSDFEY